MKRHTLLQLLCWLVLACTAERATAARYWITNGSPAAPVISAGYTFCMGHVSLCGTSIGAAYSTFGSGSGLTLNVLPNWQLTTTTLVTGSSTVPSLTWGSAWPVPIVPTPGCTTSCTAPLAIADVCGLEMALNSITTGGTYYLNVRYTVSSTVTGAISTNYNGPQVAITIIDPTATITATPATAMACSGVGVTLSATAAGGATFSWTPSTGLSSTTAATTVATPSSATVYSLTTTVGGCSATTTTTVYSPVPFGVSAVATDPIICTGGSTTLTSAIAGPASSEFNTATSITPPSLYTGGTPITTFYDHTGAVNNDDGSVILPLPGPFYYYGIEYNSIGVSTNGFITFANGSDDNSNYALPNTAAPRNMVALFYHDMDPGAGGQVRYDYVGTTMHIIWDGVRDAGSVTPDNSGEIIIDASANTITLLITNCANPGPTFITEGVQDLMAASSVTVTGRNGTTFSVSTPDAYLLTATGATPYTYSWTPVADISGLTTLPNATTAALSGTTLFNVVATDRYGCDASASATVTVNPGLTVAGVTTSGTNPMCAGGAIILTPGAVTGGSGGPITYTWTNSVTAAVVTGPTLSDAPTTTITYNVVADDGVSGCASPAASITIGVVPSPTLSGLSISPAFSSVCSGTSITLSDVGLTGGTGTVTYTWTGGPGLTSVSTSTSPYIFSPTVGSTTTGSYGLTVSYSSTGCIPASVSSTAFTVTPAGSQAWTGATSADWNDGNNWSCGHVPVITEDVLIPHVTTNNPTLALTGATTGYAHNLTMTGSPTILTLAATNTLVVDGNLTVGNSCTITMNSTTEAQVAGNVENQGTITGAGKLVMNGTSAQTIKSTGTGASMKTISNLEMNNSSGGVSIVNTSGYDPIGITTALTFNSTCTTTLTTNNYLTMLSSSSGTAYIYQIPTGASVSGEVTCQQYIPGGHRAWRFFGHPFNAALSGGLSQVASGFDISGTGSCFTACTPALSTAYYYKIATSNSMLANDPGWTAYTSACGGGTNDFNRYQGIRMLVRGTPGQGLTTGAYTPSATTFSWHGSINQGNQYVPMTCTADTATSATTFSNFSIPLGGYNDYSRTYNLLGNPYPCPVNISAVLARNYSGSYAAGYSNTVHGTTSSRIYTPYFWLFQPNMGTSGQYLPQSFGTSYNIPAHTMFQVRMNPLYVGGMSTTLDFTEADKVTTISYTGTAALFRHAEEFTVLNVTAPDGNLWDVIKLNFNEEATANEDRELDANKLMGFDYNFFTVSKDAQPLSFDYRPFKEDEAITLGMNGNTSEHLTIVASSVVAPEGKALYLHDKLLHEYKVLTEGMEYPFYFDATSTTQGDRFELVMKPAESSSANPVFAFIVDLMPNPAGEEVNVVFTTSGKENTTIRLMDVTGAVIQVRDAGAKIDGHETLNLHGLASGVYMVEVSCGKDKAVQKLVKE